MFILSKMPTDEELVKLVSQLIDDGVKEVSVRRILGDYAGHRIFEAAMLQRGMVRDLESKGWKLNPNSKDYELIPSSELIVIEVNGLFEARHPRFKILGGGKDALAAKRDWQKAYKDLALDGKLDFVKQ